MAEKYRESDYLYGSARIRALEGQRIGKDRLERMLEANTSDDVMAMLSDHGFTWSSTDGASREECLLSALSEGYAELERSADGVRSPVRFLRYPYDCNNVKALIKCFVRGIAPDAMLFDSLGTVSAEQAKLAFESKDYRMFPPCMAEAIPEAEESFAQTGNPQTVDLILDKACYADMLEDTRQSGIAYAVRLKEKEAAAQVRTKTAAVYQEITRDVYEKVRTYGYEQGHDLYNAGEYAEAVTYLLEVYNAGGTDADTLYFLARSYQRSGDEDTARVYFQMLVDQYPGSERAEMAHQCMDGLD